MTVGCAIWLLTIGIVACQAPPAAQPQAASPSASPNALASPAVPASSPDDGLPAEIRAYTNWLKLNPAPLPPRAGAPHGSGVKNVHVSVAPDASGQYADGALVVKEGLTASGDFVELVAVMHKRKGADPEHGDWIYDEYIRSRADEPFRLAFKGAVCWGCHAQAKATDWVFTR